VHRGGELVLRIGIEQLLPGRSRRGGEVQVVPDERQGQPVRGAEQRRLGGGLQRNS
jgi:hypothetical protein